MQFKGLSNNQVETALFVEVSLAEKNVEVNFTFFARIYYIFELKLEDTHAR